MKKTVKILSVFMAIVLMVAAFAACGGDFLFTGSQSAYL